ncbi:hypothetical protein O71_14866 [Pontibacter sp. BAB1700]|nr:hypothetical protein O71_14866 [Pontibacter sp. BAB1700]
MLELNRVPAASQGAALLVSPCICYTLSPESGNGTKKHQLLKFFFSLRQRCPTAQDRAKKLVKSGKEPQNKTVNFTQLSTESAPVRSYQSKLLDGKSVAKKY